jgi:hypothetical protein
MSVRACVSSVAAAVLLAATGSSSICLGVMVYATPQERAVVLRGAVLTSYSVFTGTVDHVAWEKSVSRM